ncbi:hydrolase [Candidatus Nitromaritima sp. SCGC AAA799-A02]|nr:hydrolase [Candidatus Nitromaritima sp. SCGC AAA799-A02]KMP12202.1 hydrolase [Candidatus Nitromaritima sp. SCGC AAA799-C22]
MALEDELGDIIQKARDGKSWSQGDLAKAAGLSAGDIGRIECYDWIPEEAKILKLARLLDLDGPALVAIADGQWEPEKEVPDPGPFDIICLDVFMGLYPVKCYLVVCRETRATAVVDTGGNPEAVIKKVCELGVRPEMILLTHAHADHAGGLSQLDRAFQCPAWIDKKEPRPSGSRDLRIVGEGDSIALGKLKIEALATRGHTPGGISYRINRSVLSGDAIFAGSMGRANSSWSELFHSITRNLLTLPEDTRLYPGHGPSTTVGEEKKHNPFFCGKVP